MRLFLGAMCLVATLANAESKIVCSVETEAPILMDPQMLEGWRGRDVHNSPAKFYKDVNGAVHLSGFIWKFDTVAPQGEVVFVLPQGYRPTTPEWFYVFSQHGMTPVVVFESGAVQVFAQSGPISDVNPRLFALVSLSGVSFKAQ